MEEESPINPSSADLACWLFIVAMIFNLVAPCLYEGQRHTQPRIEEPGVPNQVIISRGDQSAQIDEGQAHPDFHLNKGLDESIGGRILESSPEKRPAAIPRNSSKLVNKKEAEHLFYPIISQAANRHQIDPALVKAIIMAESGYDPKAISKRGAKGLMQLMPQTAEALGVKDCFNPEHNINAGVRYFRQLLNQFEGDVKLALAAYNAGGRKVRKYQGIPPFKATQYYVKKVFEYYQYYKKQMAGDVSRA